MSARNRRTHTADGTNAREGQRAALPAQRARALAAGSPWALKVGVSTLAVLAVGAGGWAFTSGASASEYSTVEASRRTVVGGLELTGTVTASGRADLSFAAGGTVTKVLVEEGDEVAKGDVLARLDRTSLKRALTKAQAALDEAQATLASDLEAQAAGVLATTTSSTTTSPTTTSPTTASPTNTSADAAATTSAATSSKTADTVSAATDSSHGSSTEVTTAALSTASPASVTATTTATATATATSSAVAAAMAEVSRAQQSVLTAQTAASSALATARTALTQQQQVCADDVTSTGCAEALVAVQDAQTAVADAQDTLQSALTALTTALDAAVAAVEDAATTSSQTPTPTPTPTPEPGQGGTDQKSDEMPDEKTGQGTGQAPGGRSGQGDGSDPSTPSAPSGQDSTPGASTPGGSSGRKVTAATIASDQAAVDQARADLLEAEAALADATLKAPADGVVRVLDLAVGDEVSSSDVVAVLVSDDVTAVDASVDVTQVGALAVDQQVEVTLPGRSDAVAGTLASVASAPSTGTSTFAVRVLVQEPDLVHEGLAQDGDDTTTGTVPLGSGATMTVVTETAEDVVSVPLSALSVQSSTAAATGGVVQVLTDGVVETRRVTLGTVGATHVAVTEGLEEGEDVVLADLAEDSTSGAAGEVTTSRRGSGGAGGFPGGAQGGPGGSFPGTRGGR